MIIHDPQGHIDEIPRAALDDFFATHGLVLRDWPDGSVAAYRPATPQDIAEAAARLDEAEREAA